MADQVGVSVCRTCLRRSVQDHPPSSSACKEAHPELPSLSFHLRRDTLLGTSYSGGVVIFIQSLRPFCQPLFAFAWPVGAWQNRDGSAT